MQVEVNETTHTVVPNEQLQMLMNQLDDYQRKEEEIATVCLKAMKTIGLADPVTGKMKPEANEGKGIFSILIKTFKDKISVTDYMFNKKKFEEDLAKEFDFLEPLLKIGSEYAAKKQL